MESTSAINRRRRTSVSIQRRSIPSNVFTSIEILENIRKAEEQRRNEEKRKEKEASMKDYFRKEESRMKQLIPFIKSDDLWINSNRGTDNENTFDQLRKKNKEMTSHNQSFYCVHMLLKYQESMLCESYVAPSPIRGRLYDNREWKTISTSPSPTGRYM